MHFIDILSSVTVFVIAITGLLNAIQKLKHK